MRQRTLALIAALLMILTVALAPSAATADTIEPHPVCLNDDRGWTCDEPYEGTPDITVRITGADRYETAVQLSQRFYPDGADIVFIASGTSTVDALVAGSTNAGPVLLVPNDRLPLIVLNELDRLNPAQVIVLGPVDAGVQSAIIVFTQ